MAESYLAQCRSRRRLLARECERRATELRDLAARLGSTYAPGYRAMSKEQDSHAAKLTRWAKALKGQTDGE